MDRRHAGLRGQRGQTIVAAAIVMVVVIGFTAMAIDVGLAYRDRRDLQNDADAAALAGVQHLPLNIIAAEDAARQWLTNNGIRPNQVTDISVESSLVANDTLRVEVDDDFGWIFGRVLGLTTSNVGAHARARVGSVQGSNEMMPWAILQGDSPCLDAAGNAIFGIDCQVKVGAGSSISGWYGALDFDGSGGGSAEYLTNIVDNSTETTYCAEGNFVEPCPGSTTVESLAGNKVAGTGQGIADRLATGPACDANGNGTDDFDEVFAQDPNGISEYIVVCPDSPRAVIIPIVAVDDVPALEVRIVGWTLAYLESYACVDGGGGNQANCNTAQGHWEVTIQIVNASYSQIEGYLGAFVPGGITGRRLIE
jgi:hypothetical protein